MTKEDAIKYLKQLYPNGGHCWLDEQRIEAIGMAVKSLQEEHISTRDKLRALSDGKQHLGWLDDAREVEEEPVSDIEAYQSRWGKSIGFINKSTSDEIGDYDHKAVMESLCPQLKEEPTIPDIVDEHYDEMLGEEPVIKVWHDASENPKEEEYLICVYKDNRYHIGKIYKDEFNRLLVSDNKNIIELCMFEKWAYIEDLLKLPNVELPKEIEL